MPDMFLGNGDYVSTYPLQPGTEASGFNTAAKQGLGVGVKMGMSDPDGFCYRVYLTKETDYTTEDFTRNYSPQEIETVKEFVERNVTT